MALTLGEKVQRMREKMGWTRKELAERAGLHPSHIGLIERGGRTEVRPETLEKLASALKVPLMYLMTDDPIEYLRMRQASMSVDEYKRFIHMSREQRIRYVLDDVMEKWGPETATIVQKHPDFQLVVSPLNVGRTLPHIAQSDNGTKHVILVHEGHEYAKAVKLALKHGITGEDLLMAVEFLCRVKGHNPHHE